MRKETQRRKRKTLQNQKAAVLNEQRTAKETPQAQKIQSALKARTDFQTHTGHFER